MKDNRVVRSTLQAVPPAIQFDRNGKVNAIYPIYEYEEPTDTFDFIATWTSQAIDLRAKGEKERLTDMEEDGDFLPTPVGLRKIQCKRENKKLAQYTSTKGTDEQKKSKANSKKEQQLQLIFPKQILLPPLHPMILALAEMMKGEEIMGHVSLMDYWEECRKDAKAQAEKRSEMIVLDDPLQRGLAGEMKGTSKGNVKGKGKSTDKAIGKAMVEAASEPIRSTRGRQLREIAMATTTAHAEAIVEEQSDIQMPVSTPAAKTSTSTKPAPAKKQTTKSASGSGFAKPGNLSQRACITCAKTHYACNKALPSCGRCTDKQLECVYPEVSSTNTNVMAVVKLFDQLLSSSSSSSRSPPSKKRKSPA